MSRLSFVAAGARGGKRSHDVGAERRFCLDRERARDARRWEKVLAGGARLAAAVARASVAARCWAGAAAAVSPELGRPRKEAGEGKRRKRAGRLGEKKKWSWAKSEERKGSERKFLLFFQINFENQFQFKFQFSLKL